MLNNLPEDLAEDAPNEHKFLREIFDYKPLTLDMEIQWRLKDNKI